MTHPIESFTLPYLTSTLSSAPRDRCDQLEAEKDEKLKSLEMVGADLRRAESRCTLLLLLGTHINLYRCDQLEAEKRTLSAENKALEERLGLSPTEVATDVMYCASCRQQQADMQRQQQQAQTERETEVYL